MLNMTKADFWRALTHAEGGQVQRVLGGAYHENDCFAFGFNYQSW